MRRLAGIGVLLAMASLGAVQERATAPLFAVSTTPAAQKRVLVLYSTRRDAQVSVALDRDLPRILEAGLPEGVDLFTEYLDLARAQDPRYFEGVRDFLEIKFNDVRFDLVIAMQDSAIAFIQAYRDALFPDTGVVFLSAGIDSPITGESWSTLRHATGVVVTPPFGGTIDLAAALQPNLEQVFVVTGAGVIDREYERLVRGQLRPFEQRFRISYLAGMPMPDLIARVAQLPPRSMVYFVMLYQDGARQNFHPLHSLDTIAKAANAPVYSWVESAVDRGIIGGYVKDQTLQTEIVGALALRILKGERPEAIPISTPAVNVNVVDWRQLAHWGISETRVPAGTQVRFRSALAWDRYRPYVFSLVTVLIAQAALITGLVFQGRKRQQAESGMKQSESALRDSYERIRNLGARLLHAQEAERARIARELHDDISQQIALLEIDLTLLPSAGDDPTLGGALPRLRAISRSVHDLSHRLHPAKLGFLSLAGALHGFEREMSLSGIRIAVTEAHAPHKLSPPVTLCLFRIAQEALQNAVKYSGAEHVTIHLAGDPRHVTLTISDDGEGFDVQAVWGKGLGLISMNERLEAVGGTLTITSGPVGGTMVVAMVPLQPVIERRWTQQHSAV